MPLPDPVIRPSILVKPDTNMVLTDHHSLTRVGLQSFAFATEDCADDLLFQLGFFLSQLRLGGGREFVFTVGIGIGEVEEIVGEEKVFEGLRGEERRRGGP
ncbi:Uncharacterized protein Fot_36722 [Forsythia ovata]|uniref:Uncharacterized protein n=1 Tax=Forsythia ovata TaxID=205694 RepID=A0ABD1SRU0_9LAMI